eukprot:883053-Rhodomonas_salina.4
MIVKRNQTLETTTSLGHSVMPLTQAQSVADICYASATSHADIERHGLVLPDCRHNGSFPPSSACQRTPGQPLYTCLCTRNTTPRTDPAHCRQFSITLEATMRSSLRTTLHFQHRQRLSSLEACPTLRWMAWRPERTFGERSMRWCCIRER